MIPNRFNTINDYFNPYLVISLTLVAITRELKVSKYAIKNKPKNLKTVFTVPNLLATIIMFFYTLK